MCLTVLGGLDRLVAVTNPYPAEFLLAGGVLAVADELEVAAAFSLADMELRPTSRASLETHGGERGLARLRSRSTCGSSGLVPGRCAMCVG